MSDLINMKFVVNSIVFSIIGVIILLVTFWVIEVATPRNLWKEIIEKQNIALAIMAGATILGMAWIIAAAVHG